MTTPRLRARMRSAAGCLAIIAGLLTLAGCDPRMALYFLQPNEPTVDALGKKRVSLKGKKVVILTTATANTQADSPDIDREISKEVASALREKVRKIHVVDPERVADWLQDHPTTTDPAEAAKAFDADVVIALEVEEFETQNLASPDLLRGHSRVHIKAITHDYPKTSKGKPNKTQPKESKEVYDANDDTDYPKNSPIPVGDGRSTGTFRKTFIQLVAKKITWHFVDHLVEEDNGESATQGQ